MLSMMMIKGHTLQTYLVHGIRILFETTRQVVMIALSKQSAKS